MYEMLKEEEYDDELLLNLKNKIKSIGLMFLTRKSEWFFEKLIQGHIILLI